MIDNDLMLTIRKADSNSFFSQESRATASMAIT